MNTKLLRKKLFFLVSVVLVLCFVGNATGATIGWDHHYGTDNLWTTAGNWAGSTVPGPNDFATIHGNNGSPPYVPEFSAGMTESISTLRLGWFTTPGHDTLDFSGGSLSVNNTGETGNSGDVLIAVDANNPAVLEMSGGTLAFEKQMTVGANGGDGSIYMTGGSIVGTADVNTCIYISPTGNIDLYGGDILLSNLSMGDGATMDITEGVLTLNGHNAYGAMFGHLQSKVDDGSITAYGGDGTVYNSWNATAGEAKMWAEPFSCTLVDNFEDYPNDVNLLAT